MENITTPKIATFLMLFMAFGSANAADNVVFTNGLQVQPVITTSTVSRLYLDIIDSSGSAAQMAIVYMEPCTEGIDYGFDASIFQQSNVTSIYTIVENYHLIIQALPEFTDSSTVTMGYTASTAGTYTININHYEGVFSSGQTVYILDKSDGTIINLSEGGYSFSTEAGEFNDRFQVQYTPNTLGTGVTQQINDITIYQHPGSINISSGNGTISSIAVYDLNGRSLYENPNVNATETEINAIQTKNQLVIIRVKTAKATVTKKIML